MTLGNAIKLIRTAKGFKQRTLAAQLDISSNYLSLLEKDKREPSVSFLRKLAKELDVPVGLFFLWQDENSPALRTQQGEVLRDLLARIQAVYIGRLVD